MGHALLVHTVNPQFAAVLFSWPKQHVTVTKIAKIPSRISLRRPPQILVIRNLLALRHCVNIGCHVANPYRSVFCRVVGALLAKEDGVGEGKPLTSTKDILDYRQTFFIKHNVRRNVSFCEKDQTLYHFHVSLTSPYASRF